jgi:hypothetical protein
MENPSKWKLCWLFPSRNGGISSKTMSDDTWTTPPPAEQSLLVATTHNVIPQKKIKNISYLNSYKFPLKFSDKSNLLYLFKWVFLR